ncbi:MAG: VRR-NUC domain-containing protein [Pigmentiphaga sp.]|nr:VRR-NUC domain-containing protein [Pigmentiphaga sp.]
MNASPPPLQAASLQDPRYYLLNVRAVLDWVGERHADLLLPSELERLAAFAAMEAEAQALLVRLVMRSHDSYRLATLRYPEIAPDLEPWARKLAAADWLELDPPLGVDTLGRLLRAGELRSAAQACLDRARWPASARKSDWVAALAEAFPGEARSLPQWWPAVPGAGPVVQLTAVTRQWFRRLRLMFFGNLRQDWSEFVLTELGHQRYEPVIFDREARAFQARTEIDQYLLLADLGEQLAAGSPVAELWPTIPAAAEGPWLARRHSRLLLEAGMVAERQGETALAMAAYQASSHPEAALRGLRLREKQMTAEALWPEVSAALAASWPEAERQGLHRIARRVARRAGLAWQAPVPPAIPERELVLARDSALSVEQSAAAALTDDDSCCVYVENHLFNGLLGLLCWPAIYEAVPGAFFHPFQAGPADLYRPEFTERRAALLEACLASLDDGGYQDRIWHTWRTRHGTSCPLIVWPVLNEDTVRLALDCIAPTALKAILQRLLADLRQHRSGLPDLVRFWPAQRRFALIEVKGPGDRLQDHQRAWLDYCRRHGLDAEVLHVRWAA